MRTGHYLVRPTSKEARKELVSFLEEQGFTYYDDTDYFSIIKSQYPIIIDLVPRTMNHIRNVVSAAAAVPNLTTENEFYSDFSVNSD